MTEERDYLKELMDMARTGAMLAIKNDGDTIPVFFAQHPGLEDGKAPVGVYFCPWSSEAEKNAIVDMLTQQFKEAGVIRYAFCCTAWVASYTDEQTRKGERPKVMPSDRPDREEVLIITAVEPGRPPLHETRKIIRRSEKDADVGEPEPPQTEMKLMGGRMVEMLGPIARPQ